jgi:hypothetical protein
VLLADDEALCRRIGAHFLKKVIKEDEEEEDDDDDEPTGGGEAEEGVKKVDFPRAFSCAFCCFR